MCVRLVSAVERDDESRLQQLLSSLDHQLQQQQPRSEGNSGVIMQLAKCLYIAAARGHLRCARLLVDAGAQPNIRGDTNGNTPLVRTSTLYATVTASFTPVCLSLCLSPCTIHRVLLLLLLPALTRLCITRHLSVYLSVNNFI